MSKAKLPTYTIDTLKDRPALDKDIVADGLAHYIDEHRNLKFPHKHNFYHLVYFSKGGGSHSIDFVQFPVEAGQIYFMIPGQVHSWEFEGEVDGFIVNFSEFFILSWLADPRYLEQFRFLSGNAKEQVIQLQQPLCTEVETALNMLVKEVNDEQPLKDDLARTSLLEVLIRVSRVQPQAQQAGTTGYNTVLMHNFRKLIEQHFKEKRLTKDYAAMLYITPNHLNALCKNETGRPAGELIRDRVLLEAKRLLINARMSITEIAHELDFEDNSYFSKFFKKYEGITPEVFRKQIIKK